MKNFIPMLLLALSSTPLLAAGGEPRGNVILLMLDGVRWQDVFRDQEGGKGPVFRRLWQTYMREGVIYGNVDKDGSMQTSNDAYMSLPGYQSIMAGLPQEGCSDNDCGRIRVETVEERIRAELKLDRLKVATIASWDKIPHAVEHVEGTTFVNAAHDALDDGTFDPEFRAINEASAKDTPPWEGARYDRYTWALAMHYLKKHQPKFLFISLDDSDEWAHKGEREAYEGSLAQYDAYIAELITLLKTGGRYGAETTLIVTTDHGRGDGEGWRHHGWLWPESKYVWLYARPASASYGWDDDRTESSGYTHSDIRPTIENAMGLAPRSCDGCGRPIRFGR